MTVSQAFQLALQHHQAGRLAEAEALYRQTLAAQPKHPEALHFLGIIAHQVGRDDLAVDLIRQSIVLDPNNPAALSNLGEACRALGQLDDAIAAFRRALQLRPDFPEALNNLGLAFRQRGQLDEAMANYRRALALKPGYPEAHFNLAIALRERGQLDEAMAAYRCALELKPDYPDAHNNLGNALRERGHLDEAVAAYRRALQIKPDDPDVHTNLGNALRDSGQLDEAIANYRRALQVTPDFAEALNNLGLALRERGQLDEAIAAYRHALALKPNNPRTHSNLIFALHFHPGHDAGTISEEHARWNRQFAAPLQRFLAPHGNARTLDRPLRVGYVSPDFRDHVVGRYVIPLFERHDRERFEILCYSGEDRMSDRFLEGAATPESRNRERVHLVESYWCYDPCGLELEIQPLPALESGQVTFGCVGHFGEVNERVLSLWARVLGAVKDSRLVLWSPAGNVRVETLELLRSKGIESRRVEFVGQCSRREYMELYHRLDIVLDTFPYNGHTTSLDALWMGVPVVSLAGQTPVSRAGLSQLSNLGLPELAAHSQEDYLRITVELAGDLPRLADLRATLRARMQASPLMDATRFAQSVEAAYRSMWARWCAGESALRDK